MLRHHDGEFSAEQKARYLGYIARQLHEKVPSADDEDRNPAIADAFHARTKTWLQANTRDRRRLNILFEENITYGFRRNRWALKWPALAARRYRPNGHTQWTSALPWCW